MSQIQTVKSRKLTWLNITNTSEQEINYLKKKFKFNQLDLNDSYAHKHAERPKINFRPDYIFLILLFPVYNRQTREIKPAEIDIYITKDHLITLHYNRLQPFKDFFQSCLDKKLYKENYLNQSPAMLLYEILDQLYQSIYPMIDHLSLNIDNIEKNMFLAKERQMVTEILIIKRNIVYFRKIMQVHKNILKKMCTQHSIVFNYKENHPIFYNDLLDYTKNIWDLLENYQQTINALEDTNNALVTFKLNDIMRTLTIFSVIVFPLTLMAAIFGMNTSFMPIVGHPYDFWIILSIMGTATLLMFLYFKHKKWI
jgi:magnesium transporter